MPELPEVETVRRDLERLVVGRRVVQAECSGRCIRRHPSAADFAARVAGAAVDSAGRHGKYLLLALDSGETLVLHLGMSGQVLLAPGSDPVPKHTHVRLWFADDGPELRFVDPRTFGEVFVTEAESLPLGVDAMDPALSPRRFGQLLAARRTQLKPLLLDQRFLAGIGNLYADEILWQAKLRFDRAANSLTGPEVRRLHKAMRAVLGDAIEHRGSSLADEQYRDAFGEVGRYQLRHNAYGREGQPCRRCRTPIQRLKWSGRSTFLCPRCQA